MAGALIDNLQYDSEEMRLYLQEKLVLEVTECIAELMVKENVRKVDIARKLKKSKGFVTQILNGRANMTLKTISDIMWALGGTLNVSWQPVRTSEQHAGSLSTKGWIITRMAVPNVFEQPEIYSSSGREESPAPDRRHIRNEPLNKLKLAG